MATTDICHRGTVVAVEPQRVKVLIESHSGCASCSARSACAMGESKPKEIEVGVVNSAEYAVGDEVSVVITMGMGRKAVVLSYVVPLGVLLGVMIVCGLLAFEEWLVALLGFAGVAIYFCGLYIFRDKIEKEINFRLIK
ncbi:MAG: SoxR reducing system RseC family protein [Rikenellaceae bacterium]